MDYNLVIVVGRVSKAPAWVIGDGPSTSLRFTVAVTGREAPKPLVSRIKVTAFNDQAHLAHLHLKKGSHVMIVGSMTEVARTSARGNNYMRTEIHADRIRLLDTKADVPAVGHRRRRHGI